MYLSESGEEIPEGMLSEQELVAQGLAPLPVNLAELEQPVVAAPPQQGDRVQARLVTGDTVTTSEFTVTRINAEGDYVGSNIGRINPATGWTVEVISRAALPLPTRRETITAVLVDGRTVTLTGKRGTWMDENGDLVDAELIRDFTVVPEE